LRNHKKVLVSSLTVSSLEVFEFDARAMPGAKLAHRPNSIPMIGAMPYTEYVNTEYGLLGRNLYGVELLVSS